MNASLGLKVVFMGTPAFAVPMLSTLVDRGYDVIGVFTQPDRQAGRGKQVAAPAVKQTALERGLRVFQPTSLRRDKEARQQLVSLSPDVIVVAAYGLFLPSDTLNLPRLGCLNVHPSLLPRYRGPSPVVSAILNGDAITGVTIMKLDEGMDSGPIVIQRQTPIGADETTGELTARLFQMGAELLVEVLPGWELGEVQAQPQDESEATVTSRLTKESGEIEWSRPAAYIARHVRAYRPWPGSFTHWRGKSLKVIEASAVESEAEPSTSPGRVTSLPDGVGVVTGSGVLELRTVQLEGRRAISGRDFVRGYRDFLGSEMGA